MKVFLYSFSVGFLAISGPVNAHSTCDSAIGDQAEISSLDDLLTKLAPQAPLEKGEFETSAEFEARRAKASEALQPVSFALSAQVDQEQISYDADAQRWMLKKYFINNGFWNFDRDTVEANGLGGAGDFRSIVLHSDEKSIGTYSASNSMGAQVTVYESVAQVIGVIEFSPTARKMDKWSADHLVFELPERALEAPDRFGKQREFRFSALPMGRDDARRAKGNFGLVVIGSLREPFQLTYTHQITATMSNPHDRTIHHMYIVADVECGLVTDGSGRVVHKLNMQPPF